MDAQFTVKTTFAKQQLEYGKQRGYETLILAINKEEKTKGDYVSNLSLREAIAFLQRKVNMYDCVLNCFQFKYYIKIIGMICN